MSDLSPGRASVKVGIVGGSIAGCLTAAALARAGYDVTVLERSPQKLQERGAGITVPRPLIDTLKEMDLVDDGFSGPSATRREWRSPASDERFGRLDFTEPMGGAIMQHWGGLFQNLRSRIPSDRYTVGTAVVAVLNRENDVLLTLADGSTRVFDLVVGADGYRSTVRKLLFPDIDPVYAGYSAWRGILDESVVRDAEFVDGATQMVGVERGHAGFYLVPGARGEVARGERQVNWLIYDGAAPRDVIGVAEDARGRLTGSTVPPGQLSSDQLDYLFRLADEQLPPWHREVVRGTPDPYLQSLHDLTMDRFVAGHVCLVGDAATIARPHTGSGASKAMQDALALTAALGSGASVDDGLRRYEEVRAPAGHALVELGRELGRDQVTEAPEWRALDDAGYQRLLYGSAGQRTYFTGASGSSR